MVNSARSAWILLAGIVVLVGVMAVDRDLRSPITAASSVAAAVLVLVGVMVHRPGTASWPSLALMLCIWSGSVCLVSLQGYISPVAVAGVWAGQSIAAGVLVHAVLSGPRSTTPSTARSLATVLDFIIISTVLAVVGVQIVTAKSADSAGPTAIIVASVDVALLGMLVRYAVSRRRLGPSSVLVLVAAFVAIAYDLNSAVHGRRLGLPGDPSESLGVAGMLLFAVAALHPSMTEAFSIKTFSQRRPASTALLGLLPLVLVPSAVSWVAALSGAPPLPAWAVPSAGAIVAALCLLRASAALRSSEHLAEHDPLTDLANRRGLARAFDDLSPAAERSLLLIDVDEFKQINDTHGHDIGDAVLLLLRDRLLGTIGESGLVARLGGDEFVVLTEGSDAHGLADRFLHSLQAPFLVDGLALKAGASIGIAHSRDGTSLTDLLTQADVAMYAAKAAGGTRALDFDPAMRVEVARRFTLSSEIRQLLGSDNRDVGHLEIHYQPLVDLRSAQVIGAEALVRWRHPRLGLLAPDSFLALVSNNNLDSDLDWAVLSSVIEQLVRWREEDRRALPVSVNLTRDSLEDPQLAQRILTALSIAGLPTSQLHVEITEHHHVSRDSPAQHTLHQLHAAGVGVYLDDYGTGYTSLEYLHRFPIQVIKLDRSVVTSLDDGGGQLLAGVKAMAVALDLEILAEGVETTHQRDRLLELGIGRGQGYLFSRPLPGDTYADSYLGSDDTAPVTTTDALPSPRTTRKTIVSAE